MKTLLITLIALIAAPVADIDQLNLGDQAPKADLKMTNVDGKALTLNDLRMENGLCVIYSCNTCPWVIAWEDRYNDLYKTCKENNIGFVLVNSNEAKRGNADSMEEMQVHAKEKGYADFAYVVDKNHVLADAFGATKTPDVFLFDGKMQLAYKGAIDDNSKDKNSVKETYLQDAIKAVSAGKTPEPGTTKALGCSIKRTS